ncbi:WAS/WASL-interacting protein family member 1-like [Equus caballus]|uniref:WAS/WASL-interacting protein family member 1-like n=1 Tax=Equus caballus TaxID=9796 RepID=UPI0038B2E945
MAGSPGPGQAALAMGAGAPLPPGGMEGPPEILGPPPPRRLAGPGRTPRRAAHGLGWPGRRAGDAPGRRRAGAGSRRRRRAAALRFAAGAQAPRPAGGGAGPGLRLTPSSRASGQRHAPQVRTPRPVAATAGAAASGELERRRPPWESFLPALGALAAEGRAQGAARCLRSTEERGRAEARSGPATCPPPRRPPRRRLPIPGLRPTPATSAPPTPSTFAGGRGARGPRWALGQPAPAPPHSIPPPSNKVLPPVPPPSDPPHGPPSLSSFPTTLSPQSHLPLQASSSFGEVPPSARPRPSRSPSPRRPGPSEGPFPSRTAPPSGSLEPLGATPLLRGFLPRRETPPLGATPPVMVTPPLNVTPPAVWPRPYQSDLSPPLPPRLT